MFIAVGPLTAAALFYTYCEKQFTFFQIIMQASTCSGDLLRPVKQPLHPSLNSVGPFKVTLLKCIAGNNQWGV